MANSGGIKWYNFLGTIFSVLKNEDTVSRTRTIADRDGRILDDTDLSTINTSISAVSGSKVYNIENYGAVHNGKTVYDGSISATSATLTSATAVFTTSDVGKIILVSKAGAAAATLKTTILSFISATQVTLAASATTTSNSAVVTYGTDDTASFTAAIAAVITAGQSGVIYLPNGMYIINGALQNSVSGSDPNCQIAIPSLNWGDIQFVGESWSLNYSPSTLTGWTDPIRSKGVILMSTLTTASGTTPAIMGTKGAPANYLNFNLAKTVIRNIDFRTWTNGGATFTMSGFNGRYFALMDAENVSAGPDFPLVVSPAGSSTTGFIFSQISNNGPIYLRNVYAYGYNYGMVMGEHVIWDGIYAGFNVVGIAHLSTDYGCAGVAHVFANVYDLLFQNGTLLGIPDTGSVCPVDVILESEFGVYGQWYDTLQVMVDTGNKATGVIRYKNSLTSTKWTTSIGSNVIMIPYNQVLPMRYNMAGGLPTSNAAVTANTPVFEIGKGTAATASDGYPVLQMAADQANTSGNVSVTQTINKNAGGGFLSTRNVNTDGALNTSKEEMYMWLAGVAKLVLTLRPTGTTFAAPVILPYFANDAAADAASAAGSAPKGTMYYNTTTDKAKIKENATWKTFTTS